MRRTFIGILVGLVVVGMLGCSKSTSDSSVVITDIATGRSVNADKTIAEPTDRFRPGDPVYVSIRTQGAAPRATLKVQWTYQTGQVVSEAEQEILPKGSTVTEFHMSKPDGWPSGEYQVTVIVNNGGAKATKTIKVL